MAQHHLSNDYIRHVRANTGENPAAAEPEPQYFAIMQGLQGGYLPNRVTHVEGIEAAREMLAEELDRAADYLAEVVSDTDTQTDASDDIAQMGLLAVAAQNVRAMPAEELAQGFWEATDEWNMVKLVPIAAEDFDPDAE